MGQRVVVITGCSSGIGYVSALALACDGWKVFATVRDSAKGREIQNEVNNENLDVVIVKLDVSDTESVKMGLRRVLEQTDRIDLLVNNAGYGLVGALEDTDLDQIWDQFNTNFFGCIRMIQELMPVFRRQQSGHIINVTSVGGLVAVPLCAAYCASKFALEGLTESLRFELSMHNVKVSNVEPGAYATNFASNSRRFAARMHNDDSPYGRLNKFFLERTSSTKFSDPQEVAKMIVAIADGKKKSFWNPIGPRTKEVFLFKRLLGADLTLRVIAKLMGFPS